MVGRDEQTHPRREQQHPRRPVSPRPTAARPRRAARSVRQRAAPSRGRSPRATSSASTTPPSATAQRPVAREHGDEHDERQVHEALRPHVHRGDEERQERGQEDDRERRRLGAASTRVDAGGDERAGDEDDIDGEQQPDAADRVEPVDRELPEPLLVDPVAAARQRGERVVPRDAVVRDQAAADERKPAVGRRATAGRAPRGAPRNAEYTTTGSDSCASVAPIARGAPEPSRRAPGVSATVRGADDPEGRPSDREHHADAARDLDDHERRDRAGDRAEQRERRPRRDRQRQRRRRASRSRPTAVRGASAGNRTTTQRAIAATAAISVRGRAPDGTCRPSATPAPRL